MEDPDTGNLFEEAALVSVDAVEETLEAIVEYKMKSCPQRPVWVRQLPSKGLTFQLWPAAMALSWYLEENYGETGMKVFSHSGSNDQQLRVIELGSGTGLVGLLAARLGAQVVLTDLPQAVPNLEHNIEMNKEAILADGGLACAQALRWGVEDDVKGLICGFDIVLASDVVYYDHLFSPLLDTMKWLAGWSKSKTFDNGVQPSGHASATAPLIILAHLRRWKKDSQFFKMASKFFEVNVVHRHPPLSGAQRGVTIYTLQLRG